LLPRRGLSRRALAELIDRTPILGFAGNPVEVRVRQARVSRQVDDNRTANQGADFVTRRRPIGRETDVCDARITRSLRVGQGR
jgi:hypothetical protein